MIDYHTEFKQRSIMYIKIKTLALSIMRMLGLFKLANHLTKNKIRILCYHGISLEDEHRFLPSSFMRFETFKKRIEFLKEKNFTFITLSDACEMIQTNTIQENCVVITIDDGFLATFDEMIPYLNENKIPATNYITTYYTQKDEPIFRLAAQYIFWKCTKEHINIQTIGSFEFGDLYELFDDSSLEINNQNMWKLITYAETQLSSENRKILLEHLETACAVKITPSVSKSFRIVDTETLKQNMSDTFDIQLHTHRHIVPKENELFQKEIDQNIETLNKITESTKEYKHFCYPSGVWNKKDFTTLQKNSIQSATTCEAGLADTTNNLLALPRIIESEAMSLLQFEAEICGVGDFLRSLK